MQQAEFGSPLIETTLRVSESEITECQQVMQLQLGAPYLSGLCLCQGEAKIGPDCSTPILNRLVIIVRGLLLMWFTTH